MEIGIDYQSKK